MDSNYFSTSANTLSVNHISKKINFDINQIKSVKLNSIDKYQKLCDYYQVHSDGNNCWLTGLKGKVITPIYSSVYPQYTLYQREEFDRKQVKVNCHRLFAEVFIPNVNNLVNVNHLNFDKSDFSLSNLDWCDQSMNLKHAWGFKMVSGETVKDKIVNLLMNGLNVDEISHRFGISKMKVLKVLI